MSKRTDANDDLAAVAVGWLSSFSGDSDKVGIGILNGVVREIGGQTFLVAELSPQEALRVLRDLSAAICNAVGIDESQTL